MVSTSRQVIVVAGPSGSGKSRLSRRLGLPVLNLDDFYKDGTDPSLPRILTGPNAGIADWDDPESWLLADALSAIHELCATGRTEVPIYQISADGRVGSTTLVLDGHDAFVAEGIFAQEVVAESERRGELLAAYCITQRPVVTFWRRLARDLRERRKPPLVLLRRGLALMRVQRRVVANAAAKGCRVASADQAYGELRTRLRPRTVTLPVGLRQPDDVSCGATSVVVARMLRDPAWGVEIQPHFGAVVQATHRGFRGWPRRLGTAFWSVAHQLREVEGVPYALSPWGLAGLFPGRAFDRLHRAASRGLFAGLYVGTRTLPRHVTLVVGTASTTDVDGLERAALQVFDPADGSVRVISRTQFTSRSLGLGGWPQVWCAVVPGR